MSSPIETLQERTGTADESPRVLGVAENETDDVLDALASDTSRSLFRTLYDEPGTPSEIADRCDTSVQNVHYHVSNLKDAELIEPVETVYSSKGNEMTVYGPASDPIVLVGDRDLEPRLQQSMADVVTGWDSSASRASSSNGARRNWRPRPQATGFWLRRVRTQGRSVGRTLSLDSFSRSSNRACCFSASVSRCLV